MDNWIPILSPTATAAHPGQRVMQPGQIQNVILEDSAVIETSIALFLQLPGEDGLLHNLTRCIGTKKKNSTDTNIV